MSDTVYITLDEVPVEDQDWVADGDNTVLSDEPEDINEDVAVFRSLKAAVGKKPPVLYVKFVPVKQGTYGRASVAIKRALTKAGHGAEGKAKTKIFGPFAVKNLKNFQKKNGLKPTGVYDEATHRKLAKHFDSYGKWLMEKHKRPLSRAQRQSQSIVAAALVGWQHRDQIHYTQSGWRMEGVRRRIRLPQFPKWEDCSSFATWLYWQAGCPDPNGRGYDGQGYTGTQISRGYKVSLSDLREGDLVFYGNMGNGIPSHVAIYVGNGRVVSHGSESGPLLLTVWYRRDVHSARRYF